MPEEMSNREVLLATIKSGATWLAIFIPLFLLTNWLLGFFPEVTPKLRHLLVSVVCGAGPIWVASLTRRRAP